MKTKTNLAYIVALFSCVISSQAIHGTEAENSTTSMAKKDNNSIIQVATGEYPPYNDSKDPNKGCANHLLKEIFETQGKTLKFSFRPWTRAYSETMKGDHDLTNQWSLRADRRRDFLIPNSPITADHVHIYHLKSHKFDWNELKDLKNQVIAVNRGYTYNEEFLDAVKKYKIKTQVLGAEIQNLNMLLRGRVDISIHNPKVFKRLIKDLSPSEAQKITFHEKPVLITYGYPLFAKKPGAETLIALYEKGVAAIKARPDLTKAFDECW